MERVRIFAVISVLFLPLFHGAAAADAWERWDRLFGVRISESSWVGGFGTGKVSGENYENVLLIWHLGMDLKRYFPGLKNRKDSFSAFIEPQFNPSFRPDRYFELGIVVGIQYRYPVTERWSLYLQGSVGPHYISLQTENQANGFIFSDTAGGGFYYFLSENAAVNFSYRFRHLSNAGLAKPNGGINSQFVTVGYSRFF